MTVLVTGATGLIGRSLLSQLKEVRVLSRDASRAALALPAGKGREVLGWDGTTPPAPEVFEGVSAVVHLAGEPVGDGRWSESRKRAIRESRVLGTRSLVDGMRAASRPPVLVCASAVGIYGDRGDEIVDEASAPGTGFLAEVCVEWEREARCAEVLGVRVVLLRTGVVLDRLGGALPRMLMPFRFGLGGPLGSGRQWLPWIHLDDVLGLIHHAIRSDVAGPVNLTAPELVQNEVFSRALAQSVGRSAWMRVPAHLLRAALGEAASMVLGSQRVHPAVAGRSGYEFRFAELADALRDLLGPQPATAEA